MDCSLPGSSVHGISRQEYWSGLPFPSPGDLPDPGIEPRSPALDSLLFELPGKPHMHKMECYSAIKENKELIHGTTSRNLENIA